MFDSPWLFGIHDSRVPRPRNSAHRRAAERPSARVAAALVVLFAALIKLHAAEQDPPPAAGAAPPAEAGAPAEPPVSRDPTGLVGVEDLARRCRPSVVVIRCIDRDGRALGVGSGVIVRQDGLIATNLHVIGEARPISVQLADGRSFDVVEVHAHETPRDLALIRIDANNLPALPLGDSDALQAGQAVVALGNPLGLEHSVVAGVISAVREDVDGVPMIQLAIPIEPGNSGGPVVDADGRIVGLLTLKSLVKANLGYAVAASALRPLLEQPNPVAMSRWLTIGAINPQHWQVLGGGRWTQRAGRLHAEGVGDGFGGRTTCLATTAPPPLPYEAVVSVRLVEEDGAAGLMVMADGGDRCFGFYPSSGRLRLTHFGGPSVDQWTVLKDEPRPEYRPGEWNRLQCRIDAERMQCYCNGALIYDVPHDADGAGRAGVAKFRHTTADFKEFRVAPDVDPPALDESADARLDELLAALSPTAPPLRETAAQVAELGEAAEAQILKEAEAAEQRAARLRKLAAAAHQQRVQQDLAAALQPAEGPPDLLRAALLIARLDNPEVDVEFYLREVDRLAAELAARGKDGQSDNDRFAELHRLLFEEYGFHGSRTTYHHASNSYLNEVLDDREGLPITLSVVYLEIARRAGLHAEGVGLPGHFIVRVRPADGEARLIDVFHRGAELTRDDALQLVVGNGGEWLESFLNAASPREIIIRMLRNLLGVAQAAEDREAELRYVNTILAIEPESVSDRLYRAVLCLATGRGAEGIADADWVLEQAPPEIDLDRVRQLREALEANPIETPALNR